MDFLWRQKTRVSKPLGRFWRMMPPRHLEVVRHGQGGWDRLGRRSWDMLVGKGLNFFRWSYVSEDGGTVSRSRGLY